MALGSIGGGCVATSLGLAFVLGLGFTGLSSVLLHLWEYLNVFNVISALQSLRFTFLMFHSVCFVFELWFIGYFFIGNFILSRLFCYWLYW